MLEFKLVTFSTQKYQDGEGDEILRKNYGFKYRMFVLLYSVK